MRSRSSVSNLGNISSHFGRVRVILRRKNEFLDHSAVSEMDIRAASRPQMGLSSLDEERRRCVDDGVDLSDIERIRRAYTSNRDQSLISTGRAAIL